MRPVKKFIIGSKVFFKGLPDYSPKNTNILCIMDSWDVKGTSVISTRIKDERVLFYKDMTKDEFIQDAIDSGVSKRIGKFLVPKFIRHLGLSIEDLQKLEPLLSGLDEKGGYMKVIFNSYIENGKFELTDQQRELAYQEYKKSR